MKVLNKKNMSKVTGGIGGTVRSYGRLLPCWGC